MLKMERTRGAEYVLLADDDAEDIEIVTHALAELERPPRVVIVHNGRHVLEHLQKEMARSGNIPACALIMDMNMPQMDGRETVVAIKKNEGLKDLPILLFSACKNGADELFARKWGVHAFQAVLADPLGNFKAAREFLRDHGMGRNC